MDNYYDFDINELLNYPILPKPVLYLQDDLAFLSQRLEQLSVEVNTQNIKLELETLDFDAPWNKLKARSLP